MLDGRDIGHLLCREGCLKGALKPPEGQRGGLQVLLEVIGHLVFLILGRSQIQRFGDQSGGFVTIKGRFEGLPDRLPLLIRQ